MHTPDIEQFLAEPLRMAQVAAVSPKGTPLLGSLWFAFEDGVFWFSSHPSSPLVQAARSGREVAVIVDEFSPPNEIRQVRVRGAANIATHDGARVDRIYRRYLGSDHSTWPDFFRDRVADSAWSLWSVSPDSGVATVNPDFRPTEVRWSRRDQAPL